MTEIVGRRQRRALPVIAAVACLLVGAVPATARAAGPADPPVTRPPSRLPGLLLGEPTDLVPLVVSPPGTASRAAVVPTPPPTSTPTPTPTSLASVLKERAAA